MNIVFLMAGLGTRMGTSNVPKPLLDVAGRPMIQAAVETLGLSGRHIFITLRQENAAVTQGILNAIHEMNLPDVAIIELDKLTEGPTASALAAKELIDNNEDLIVTNCDQVLNWDAKRFMSFVHSSGKDGIVVTYPAMTEKNSYIQLDPEGNGVAVAEKKIISEHSLNGVHWWKHGKDFVYSAESMMKKNIRTNNEFYIAPTYNELIIIGKKIGIYPLQEGQHFPIGTKDDLDSYLREIHGPV